MTNIAMDSQKFPRETANKWAMFHGYIILQEGQVTSSHHQFFHPIQNYNFTIKFPACFPFKSTIFPRKKPIKSGPAFCDKEPMRSQSIATLLITSCLALRKPRTIWVLQSEGPLEKNGSKWKHVYKPLVTGKSSN